MWASGRTLPYLQAAPDEYDGNEANPNAARAHVYPLADVTRWFNEYEDDRLHVGTIRSIEIDSLFYEYAQVNIKKVKNLNTFAWLKIFEYLMR